jgi:hypothetical protein
MLLTNIFWNTVCQLLDTVLDIWQNMQFMHDGAQPISVTLLEIILGLQRVGDGEQDRDQYLSQVVHQTWIPLISSITKKDVPVPNWISTMPWRHISGMKGWLHHSWPWNYTVNDQLHEPAALKETACSTHWIRGWMYPRATLDTVQYRKMYCPCW